MNESAVPDELPPTLVGLTARMDPLPPAVVAAAQSVLTWRTIDAELAELTYDSVVDDVEPVGVRASATATPRLVTFEGTVTAVEVEIAQNADGYRVVGQIVPPHRAVVEVRREDGNHVIEADDLGRFIIDGLAPGRLSLRCHITEAGQSRSIDTAWLQL